MIDQAQPTKPGPQPAKRRIYLSRDFLIVAAGRGLLAIAAILSIRLLTTLLAPSEVGRFNLLLSLSFGFVWIVLSPVGSYVSRQINEWNSSATAQRHLLEYMVFLTVTTIIGLLVAVAATGIGDVGLVISLPWLLVSLVGLVLIAAISLEIANSLNLLGHRVWSLLASNVGAWLGLLASALLAFKVSADAEHWVLGASIGNLIVVFGGILVLVLILNRNPTADANPQTTRISTIASFAWPLAVFNVLYWSQVQGYRFILSDMAGLAILGIFAAGYGIGNAVMAAFAQLITQFLNPVFYRDISHTGVEQQADAWNSYASILLPATVVTACFTIGGAPYLARLLTGPAFQAAAVAVPWGALVESLRIAISAVSLVAHTRLDTKRLILPGVVGVLVSMCGMVTLARLDALWGTGAALAAGAACWLVVVTLQMRRLLPRMVMPWAHTLRAALLGIPLIAGPLSLWHQTSNHGIGEACVVLGASASYLIFVEFRLTRAL